MCKKKVTESARTRHWKQTFPLGVAVLKSHCKVKQTCSHPDNRVFIFLLECSRRAKQFSFTRKVKQRPHFLVIKKKTLWWDWQYICMLPIRRGKWHVEKGKKVRADWQKEVGRKGGEGKCSPLNTTLASPWESHSTTATNKSWITGPN